MVMQAECCGGVEGLAGGVYGRTVSVTLDDAMHAVARLYRRLDGGCRHVFGIVYTVVELYNLLSA